MYTDDATGLKVGPFANGFTASLAWKWRGNYADDESVEGAVFRDGRVVRRVDVEGWLPTEEIGAFVEKVRTIPAPANGREVAAHMGLNYFEEDDDDD
jgi:hypothetical protein